MPIDLRPLAIFLMGPTASGKTALACKLADRFPLDLISVDSALVYRGLEVGAAKPDAATRARYPHQLIDIRDPGQPYSAAEFRGDALLAMERTIAAGRMPLLVGGTGLYFRALQYGLSDLPAADPSLRSTITRDAQIHGWPAMHQRLSTLDSAAANRIGANDAQRIQRALEIIELTGRGLTEQQGRAPAPFSYRVLKLALMPGDRALLHSRIAERMDTMLAGGFLDEVRVLRARGDLSPELPALRAVGYRQAWQHLDGQFDSAQLRDRAIFATRQLAKRQLTWLRAELDARPLDPFSPSHERTAESAVSAFLAAD